MSSEQNQKNDGEPPSSFEGPPLHILTPDILQPPFYHLPVFLFTSHSNAHLVGPLSKAADTTTASTTGPNMSTETDPAKMPKEALEAEPDAGEQNQQVSRDNTSSPGY